MLLLSAYNPYILVAPSCTYLLMYIEFIEMQCGQAICLVKQKCIIYKYLNFTYLHKLLFVEVICCGNDQFLVLKAQCGFAKLSLDEAFIKLSFYLLIIIQCTVYFSPNTYDVHIQAIYYITGSFARLSIPFINLHKFIVRCLRIHTYLQIEVAISGYVLVNFENIQINYKYFRHVERL